MESPPVYVVDDFFSHPECDALMALANNYMIISPVVGAGAGEISESRTSSSCFLAREDLPTVCRKVSRSRRILIGLMLFVAAIPKQHSGMPIFFCGPSPVLSTLCLTFSFNIYSM